MINKSKKLDIYLQTIIMLFFSVIMAVSCKPSSLTPEESLKRYIDYRFGEKQDLKEILEMTTGPLAYDLNQLDSNSQKDFLDTRNFKLSDFSIIYSKCNKDICYLSYGLRYFILSENGVKSNLVEVKKMATMMREEEKWKIHSIDNVRTNIDNLSAIDIAGTIN